MSAKNLLWIGVFVAVLYFGSGAIRGMALQNEAEAYLRESLFDIAAPWSASKINQRASTWLKDKSRLTPDEIARSASAELGSLLEIQHGPDCHLEMGFDSYSNNKHTYALCTSRIRFENKTVKLDMRLIEEDKAWKINNFISIE